MKLGVWLALMTAPVFAQDAAPVLVQPYGRANVIAKTAYARPGGVLGVEVKNGRWRSATLLFDGHRGALGSEGGGLSGLVPIPLDTEPAEHKLTLYFPGNRRTGGAVALRVPVTPGARPVRGRTLPPEAIAQLSSPTALGHARFLLRAIRTRESRLFETRPLIAPVSAPVSFGFGGREDYGMSLGPVRDGLLGEHHRGVDYDVPVGTPVKAPGAGVVVLARSLLFTGETVVINHGRGIVSVLSNLNHVNVAEGDTVSQGTVVGVSGRSGLGALTPHLCFAVYINAINVDPEALMDASLWPSAR